MTPASHRRPSQPRPPALRRIDAKNFRSFTDVSVEFGRFSVLVGPNGSGKSNLLRILRFIRDTAQFDLLQAISEHGGMSRLHRATETAGRISLKVVAQVTSHSSSTALDEYQLTLDQVQNRIERTEKFLYKRTAGKGRRFGFSTSGSVAEVGESTSRGLSNSRPIHLVGESTSALSTFARLSTDELEGGPNEFVAFLSSIRYLDPAVDDARGASRVSDDQLDDSASNLSSALRRIRDLDPDAFSALERDLRACLPGLRGINFDLLGGGRRELVTVLDESGLSRGVELADASFGTVRILSLLAALHDPNPPQLTIIEEVDHGLHPHALDVLVDRMREASLRTQIVAASHSPTLVNRLRADEVVICDRDADTGESIIPSASREEISSAVERSNLGIGELWYAGSLGGVPSDD